MSEQKLTMYILSNKNGNPRLESRRKEALKIIELYETQIRRIENMTEHRREQAKLLFDIVIKEYPKRYDESQIEYIFTDVFFYRVQQREQEYMDKIKQEYA